MRRIVGLPIMAPPTEQEIEDLSREVFLAGPFEGRCKKKNCHTCFRRDKATGELIPVPLRLFPEQAADLLAFRRTGRGLFCNRVGSGKSATCMLIAMEAFKIQDDARILLLIPASVTKQFATRDLSWARNHLSGWAPKWVVLHGKAAAARTALARSGPGVYVLSFSLLSQEDSRALLELINADMVIVDEAQHLRGKSAMQKRFWEWINGYVRRGEEPPAGVAMSGSLQTSTPSDYHPTARWVLGELSPLPRLVVECQNWANVLRSGSDKKTPLLAPDQYQLFKPLIDWARRNFPEAQKDLEGTAIRVARTAYKLRFRSTPGVVPINEDQLGISIEISNLPEVKPNASCRKLMDQVKTDWLAPDGRVLTYSIEQHEILRQLTAGFYLKHYWPEKHPRLQAAKACFKAREEYHKALREFLSSSLSSKLRLDTPKQVGRYHAQTGAIDSYEYLYDLWVEWHDLMDEGLPEQLVKLVMVDDFKTGQAVRWAKKYAKPGGIVWVEHKLFGDLVALKLKEAGLKVLRKDQGASWLHGDGSEKFVCVADRRSHYEGKNLQHHQNQLMLQWCRPQAHMEQLIGRLHRPKQEAERLIIHTSRNTEFEHMAVAATLLDTVYDKQTMGGDKKLLLADWEPAPVEYPPDFLREQGFRLLQNKKPGDVSSDDSEDSDDDGAEE